MDVPGSRTAIRRVTTPLRRALTEALNGRPLKLVVAVSGGPDSLCLLHALTALAPRLSLALHAAHLDHGLRGDAGAADRRFVAETCHAWGVACTTDHISVDDYQQAHPGEASVEAAARAVRYQFLRRVMAETGAGAVVTGHTRDDQTETVLLHLVRGAGTAGLRGMTTDSILATADGPLRVLRPLLGVARQATHRYCAASGLHPRTDETNASPSFTRNRLRHTVMPVLHTINPSVGDALSQLAFQAQRDQAYWDAEVDRVLPAVSEPFPGGLVLKRPGLRAMPSALRLRVLRAAAGAAAPGFDLSFDHTLALEGLALGASGKVLAIPDAPLFALTTYAGLVLANAALSLGPAPGHVAVGQAKQQRWGHWGFEVSLVVTRPGAPLWATPLPRGSGAVLRSRRPGDRFGRRKLQDVLVDAHCPELLRDHLPVLADADGEVVWVGGIGSAGGDEPNASASWLAFRPELEALSRVLRLWEARSYNDEAP